MQDFDLIHGINLSFWIELGMAIFLVTVGYITGHVRKQAHNTKKNLKVSWSTHSQIHELLTELRVKVDSARTQIIQFHNGEYFMDGISMKKLSLTHESLSKGVSQAGNWRSDILISLFTPLTEKIIKDDAVVYKTTNDENSTCKHIMLSNNTIAYAVLPLRYKNAISGYIMIDWCSEVKVKRIDQEQVTLFLTEARDYTEVYLKDILKEENS